MGEDKKLLTCCCFLLCFVLNPSGEQSQKLRLNIAHLFFGSTLFFISFSGYILYIKVNLIAISTTF
jgi:hypothetical protein